MSKAATAAPIPAEGVGADAATVAAPELLGAALRNPDTHLAWLEPTESETELLAALEKEHPGMPGLAGTKLRFLRAFAGKAVSKGDKNEKNRRPMMEKQLETTAIAYKAHVAWEEAIRPCDVRRADIHTSLDSGTWRFLGKTEAGNPIMWVQVAKWNPHEYKIEEYEKYVAYFCARSEHQMEKVTTHLIVFDMSGWAMWHARYISYVKKLVSIVQDQYPERLAKVLVVNAPVTFRSVWAIIKPWLDAKTAAKVEFCNGADAIAKAFEEQGVSKDVLIDKYGGNQKADEVPVPNFPDMLTPAAEATATD